MISARVIADSMNIAGNRLTTYVATYPRFIHSELMTHRVFSRNAASSRAIPVSKMIEMVENEPAMPVHWGKNQKGMQAFEQIVATDQDRAIAEWLAAMKDAVVHAKNLTSMGVHKQVVNRVLEPYMHMTTIITATEWGNFFNLRAHKDAQPEFQELAFKILEAHTKSNPKVLKPGEWHLPFCDKHIGKDIPLNRLLMISTARCARVSYLNFEGDIDPEKDYALHGSLVSSGHMSPLEHPACALASSERSGNYIGFQQYRKMMTDENKQVFNPEELIKKRYGS